MPKARKPLIDEDGDVRELTPEDFARMRPASETHPEMVEAYRRTRGRQKAPRKVATTFRLDAEVVEHFKAGGKGWQTRINEALRKAISGWFPFPPANFP